METSSPFLGLSAPLPSMRTVLVTPIVAVDRSCGDAQRLVGSSWLSLQEIVEEDVQVRNRKSTFVLRGLKLAWEEGGGKWQVR